MSYPSDELAPTNVWLVCRCGYEVEATGQEDMELMGCPECHRIGCFKIAPEVE